MPIRPLALIAALASCIAAGCVEPAEEVSLSDPLPAVVALDRPIGRPSLYGAFNYGRGWTTESPLSVCWIDDGSPADAFEPFYYDAGHLDDARAAFAQARTWAEEIVRREWARVSAIQLPQLFPSCSSSPGADIRIGHSDAYAAASFQGTEAQEVPADEPTMLINLRGPSSQGCVPDSPDPNLPPGGGIARCNGFLLDRTPASRQIWTQAVTLAAFGFALGLRSENAHPGSPRYPCDGVTRENLDTASDDGEPLWSYDAGSILEKCHLDEVAFGPADPELSPGDIRSVQSLYPTQVKVFSQGQLGGTETRLGPGYYTRATHPALASMRSIIVPPGFRVVACSSSQCLALTASLRTLPLWLDQQVQNLSITVRAFVADYSGFWGAAQWLTPGTYRASDGQLDGVGDNDISSAWVPPGLAIELCDTDERTWCTSTAGGVQGWPALVKFMSFGFPTLDQLTSYVSVTPRAVTYAGTGFRGKSYSLAVGTYHASEHAWLPNVRAIALGGGLVASACAAQPPLKGPWPTCYPLTQSGDVPAFPSGEELRYLSISVPPSNAPP